MRLSKSSRYVCIASVALAPSVAHAHLVSTRFGEFYNGLMHPLMTLSEVLPWLALGLLAGLQNANQARTSLLVFPCAVLIGAALAIFEAALPVAEFINSASLVVCGLLVVFALKLNSTILYSVLAVFGLSHGFVNGEVLLAGKEKLLFLAGLTAAAYIFITLVSAASYSLVQRFGWGTVAVRALGSWVVAIGIIFIAFSSTNIQPLVAG